MAVDQAAAFGVPDAFDVDKVITELLSNPNCASVQLPCLLSSAQRKQAKQIAEQYPQIKCESFGLGHDRQIHLFKRNECEGSAKKMLSEAKPLAEISTQHVSVKNTFIDDWIEIGESAPADTRIVQSMPHNMFTQCLSLEMSGDSFSSPMPINDKDSAAPLDTLPENTMFAVGTEVIIAGLVKAANFNGATAIVQSWDAATWRYNVLVASSGHNGEQWAKVKGDNLRLAEGGSCD
jgi:hypothetical protein